MSDLVCSVPADTKLETAEGPMPMRSLATSTAAVLTRGDDGKVVFAMVEEARKVAESVPVLRIALENGRSFRVGAAQVLLKKGMIETPAAELKVGDELEPVFTFPEGYAFETSAGEDTTSRGSWRVTEIGPGGEADLYAFRMSRTGRFMISAGVLGKAQP